MKEKVSDETIDKIIRSLNKYAKIYFSDQFGLPIHGSIEFKQMRNLVRNILNEEDKFQVSDSKKEEIEQEITYTENEKIAIKRYEKGEQPHCSTFIDEDTIIVGYGSLDIDFEFPLPQDYIKKIYGTTSWTEYLEIIKTK